MSLRLALIVPVTMLALAVSPAVALAGGSGTGAPPPPRDPQGNANERVPFAPEDLRFWTWKEPLGLAQADRRVRYMLRRSTNRTPKVMAGWFARKIKQRQLGDGEVGIVLQNFGMGGGDPADDYPDFIALFEHWCDGVAHTPVAGSDLDCELIASSNASQRWWYTPWMSHGIADARAWMEQFVYHYQQLQQRDPDLPDPARFHFDVEGGPMPQRNGTLLTFVAMQNDPRWFTEPVPGFDGRTMDELYAEAGHPHVDPGRSFFHAPNREWAKWYGGLCRQAMDGAMEEAAYSVIREAWPECKSSNYGRSARYDGLGSPPRVMPSNRKDWYEFSHNAFADIQAPVCYWAWPQWLESGESYGDASVRKARIHIDANIHSFEGPHWNIAPWMHALGNVTDSRGRDHLMTPTVVRDMLTMMRSRDIREFILWGDNTGQREHLWNMFMDVVDRVWRYEPTAYTLVRGVGQDDELEQLSLARRDPMTIESRSNPDVAGDLVAMELSFTGDPGEVEPHGFAVTTEAMSNIPGTLLRVSLRNVHNRAFEEIGRKTIGQGPETGRYTLDTNNGARYMAADGSIDVKLEFHRSLRFIVKVDTVQVVALSPIDDVESDAARIRDDADK